MTRKQSSIQTRVFWLAVSTLVLFLLWYGWSVAIAIHLAAAAHIWTGLDLFLFPYLSPVAFLIASYLFYDILATEQFRLLPLQALKVTACRSLFKMLVHLVCSMVAFCAVYLAVLLSSPLGHQTVVAIVGLFSWILAVLYFFAFGGPSIKRAGALARRFTLRFQ